MNESKRSASWVATRLSHISARRLSMSGTASSRRAGVGVAVVTLVALVALGAMASDGLTRHMHSAVAYELTTILRAEREALRLWARGARDTTETFARDPRVRSVVLEIAALSPEELEAEGESAGRLSELMTPVLERYGYYGASVVRPDGFALSLSTERQMIARVNLSEMPSVQRSLQGASAMSRPLLPRDFVIGLEEVTTDLPPRMYSSAPVYDRRGNVAAALVFTSLPEADFSRILQIARVGESGETYAFDDAGRMLSNSRFDAELQAIGLMPEGLDATSVFTVEIRAPGGRLADGHAPEQTRQEQPLTRMAASATRGGRGVDVDGYRDYRGERVVGAWDWVEELNLGLATEMDEAEAFRSLIMLRRGFWGLVALLALTLLGLITYGMVVRRLQRQVEKAERLGQYDLGKKIGEGGMGAVYMAEHALLKRPTALKLLNGEEATPERIIRFEREVVNTAKLTHPNTIAVYDFGHTADGTFYYAMELLDGLSLEELVEREGPIPAARVAHILRQAAGSLAEAHAAGMVHRDIKPANIMLTKRGGIADFVKVLDFGLVQAAQNADETKLTQANAVTGTPMYMSPEQIADPDKVDGRSDLYQLGAVAYFLLTGVEPFSGKSVVEILHHHLSSTPEAPSRRVEGGVPEALEALVLRLMEKEIEARPASAEVLVDLLDAAGLPPWTRAEATRSWHKSASSIVPAPAQAEGDGAFAATIDGPST